MPFKCFAQEAPSGREIAPFAEPEIDRVAMAIDRAGQVHPAPSDFDVGFIHMPPASDGSLSAIEPLQQLGRITNDPAMYRSVIDGDAPLGHHLFQIPEAEIVSQIPSHAEQDYRAIKMPAPEHAALRR